MSKLIGNNPNQVSSNADLGSAAFLNAEEFLSARGSSLSKISNTIQETATDVFVYDTRKDSDGGAWRHRTSETSWYNEELNTHQRGKTKRFPSVAVLVLHDGANGGLSIHDGDDPTLPLWMKFENYGTSWNDTLLPLGGGSGYLECVTAMNGIIFVGTIGNALGLMQFSFIEDMSRSYLSANYGGIDTLPLSKRNNSGHTFASGNTSGVTNTLPALSSNRIQDVAVSVLEGAPINSGTGLPELTVAVATKEGINIIQNDGTLNTLRTETNAGYNATRDFLNVSFGENGRLAFNSSQHGSSTGYYQNAVLLKNSVDTYSNFASDYSAAPDSVQITWDGNVHTTTTINQQTLLTTWGISSNSNGILPYFAGDNIAFGTKQTGLGLISTGVLDGKNALTCRIDTDFNTGWLPEQIQVSACSDAIAQSGIVNSPISNSNFATNVTGWTHYAHNSPSPSSVTFNNDPTDGGELRITSSSGGYTWAGTQVNLHPNTRYALTVDLRATGGTTLFYVRCGLSNNGDNPTSGVTFSIQSNSSNWVYGPNTIIFDTTNFPSMQPGNWFWIGGRNDQTLLDIDDVYIQRIDEPRTKNGTPFLIFGDGISKTPVAPGADLVAYSGFNAASYLRQPYTGDLEVGTDSFTTMGWYKCTSSNGSYRTLVYANTVRPASGTISTGHEGWQILINPDNQIYYYIYGPTNDDAVTHSSRTNDGNWHFFCAVTNANNNHQLYVDGRLVGTATLTVGNLNNSKRSIQLGAYGGTGNSDTTQSFPFEGGHLSNIRIAKSAITKQEIEQIYEDEKKLYQPNAKATLYGTSPTVTAIDYDSDTGLLHAGTSQGRSVFKGLRRVDNTTTSVDTTISASNGMVLED